MKLEIRDALKTKQNHKLKYRCLNSFGFMLDVYGTDTLLDWPNSPSFCGSLTFCYVSIWTSLVPQVSSKILICEVTSIHIQIEHIGYNKLSQIHWWNQRSKICNSTRAAYRRLGILIYTEYLSGFFWNKKKQIIGDEHASVD